MSQGIDIYIVFAKVVLLYFLFHPQLVIMLRFYVNCCKSEPSVFFVFTLYTFSCLFYLLNR